jgi:hypothetical protein
MNFKDAEILINLSILHNGPPLLIVGNNGIGKTAMIESVVARYKRAVFIPDRIDFGGLKKAEGQIKNLKIKTIAISDMQNILTRKSQIRTSTIGVLSSWISEGVGGNELGFNNINLTNKKKKRKNDTINMIIACTPAQAFEMFKYQYYDLLDRVIIITVNRDKSEFKDEGFRLDYEFSGKMNADVYNKMMGIKVRMNNPRHTAYFKKIIAGLASMGVEPIEFLERNMNSINTMELKEGKETNISAWIRSLSIEEILNIKRIMRDGDVGNNI